MTTLLLKSRSLRPPLKQGMTLISLLEAKLILSNLFYYSFATPHKVSPARHHIMNHHPTLAAAASLLVLFLLLLALVPTFQPSDTSQI